MTSKTVDVTGSSLVVEDRNTSGFEVNELNQIVRNAITVGGGSPTNWDYTYNLNGCMTSKTDGTNTWTYTWDDDNRLTRVQGPGGVDVSYKYDPAGRMLTRASGGVTTKFTWDGWDLVKEDDGTNVIRYYCPQGELFSIERNSTFYQVHTDALGSVRALTDSTGAVAASYTYGAWGETLSASHPSGWTLSTLFVGAYGVRFDPITGLHYMRNRWYDAGLGRFISRDPQPVRVDRSEARVSSPSATLAMDNLYLYARNIPILFIDPQGLWSYTGEDLIFNSLESCLGRAYWLGKNYEASRNLPVKHYNAHGELVYDKYVHCYTACEMNRCYMIHPFSGGYLVGGVTVTTIGGIFEMSQWLAHQLDPNKLHPLGHGTCGDFETNARGAALAMYPGSCESLCSKEEFRDN